MIPVCCTRHPSKRVTNTPTTAYRACCVETELRPHTNATAAAPPSEPPQAHHSSSTVAETAARAVVTQRRRRQLRQGTGKIFKKKGKRQKQDLPIQNKTTFVRKQTKNVGTTTATRVISF